MDCPISNLFAKCPFASMICQSCAQIALAAIAIVIGTLFVWKPKKVIEIQTAIYRPFNWRLEPISMEKEVRNTRIMGAILLVLGIISSVNIILFFLGK